MTTSVRQFCELEEGLIVGPTHLHANNGNIISPGHFAFNNASVNNGAIVLHSTGDIDLTGELNIDKNFIVNETKFIVHHDTGNVYVHGTLEVQEDALFNSQVTFNSHHINTDNETYFNLLVSNVDEIRFGHAATNITIGHDGDDSWVHANSNMEVGRELHVTTNVSIANGKITYDHSVGDHGATSILGTLEVGQYTQIHDNLKVDASLEVGYNVKAWGNTELAGWLKVWDNIDVNAGKFTVNHTTGNIASAGSLTIASNFAINTDKFVVTASNGNTTIAGTLGVTGNATLGGTLGIASDFVINADKFVVTASNGNTAIAGTLNVNGTLTTIGNFTTGDITSTGIESTASLIKLKSTNVEISDTIVYLGTGNTGATKDIGFIGHFNNGTYQHTGLLRDATDNTWKLFSNATTEITDTVDVTGVIYDPLKAGNITSTGTIVDNKGEVRAVPQNSQSSAYTLDVSDHGKHILAQNTITVPGNVFSAGQTVVVINWTGSTISLSQGSNMTMYQVGTSNTGTRTLAQRALITIFFVDTNNCIVSGSGLT